MRKLIAAGFSIVALGLGFASSADARVCARTSDGVLAAYGPTSCAFARETAVTWGGNPRPVIWVYSPVTGETYRMRCRVRTSYYYSGIVSCRGGRGAHVVVKVY